MNSTVSRVSSGAGKVPDGAPPRHQDFRTGGPAQGLRPQPARQSQRTGQYDYGRPCGPAPPSPARRRTTVPGPPQERPGPARTRAESDPPTLLPVDRRAARPCAGWRRPVAPILPRGPVQDRGADPPPRPPAPGRSAPPCRYAQVFPFSGCSSFTRAFSRVKSAQASKYSFIKGSPAAWARNLSRHLERRLPTVLMASPSASAISR
jgi:hypothetical protein